MSGSMRFIAIAASAVLAFTSVASAAGGRVPQPAAAGDLTVLVQKKGNQNGGQQNGPAKSSNKGKGVATGVAIGLGVLAVIAASQAKSQERSSHRSRGSSRRSYCRDLEYRCDDGSKWACRKFYNEC